MFAPPGTAVFLLCLLAINANSCIAFYTHRTVSISVHDAETKAPIAVPTVQLSYLCMLILNAPRPQEGSTDKNGSLRMRVATFDDRQFKITAPGYLSDELSGGGEVQAQMQFWLYRLPSPAITIVVPNNYRGPVKLDFHWVTSQEQMGERNFVFHALLDGYVRIEATPLLMKSSTSFSKSQGQRRQNPKVFLPIVVPE